MTDTGLKMAEIEENQIHPVELPDGSAVIVTRTEDGLIAFSAVCPHASGDFREGELHRGRIYCPVHQWKFDLKSGRCVGDENYRIKKYPITTIDDRVFLDL